MVAWRQAAVGGAVGLAGISVITVVCALLRDYVPVTVPALLLLVPIGVSSVIARWSVGALVAVFAAATYALEFLEPIGEVRIGWTSDVYVLTTFVLVAVVLGAITDRRQSTIDAQRALLIGSVSHDLRNPLSTIRTVSTDLLDHESDRESARSAMLLLVLDETERMSRIVSNLLSMSRVQMGGFAPSAEPTNPSDLIDTTLERFNQLGEHRIKVTIEPGLPDVLADAVQIDQAITNLVENALRYTPASDLVVIAAGRRGDHVELSVEDAGPGFGSAGAGAIQSPSRQPEGSTGLGLLVCGAIVEAHGGKLQIGRSALGGGRVAFTLPIARPSRLVS
jgi:K+-sensing histidine kinase KdpD